MPATPISGGRRCGRCWPLKNNSGESTPVAPLADRGVGTAMGWWRYHARHRLVQKLLGATKAASVRVRAYNSCRKRRKAVPAGIVLLASTLFPGGLPAIRQGRRALFASLMVTSYKLAPARSHCGGSVFAKPATSVPAMQYFQVNSLQALAPAYSPAYEQRAHFFR